MNTRVTTAMGESEVVKQTKISKRTLTEEVRE
jgi:hypothetical protein